MIDLLLKLSICVWFKLTVEPTSLLKLCVYGGNSIGLSLTFPMQGSMGRKIMHMWLRKFVFCILYWFCLLISLSLPEWYNCWYRNLMGRNWMSNAVNPFYYIYLHIVPVICILLVFGHWVCCAYMLTIWSNVSIITCLDPNKFRWK